MNSRQQEVVGAARKYAESYSLSASQEEQQDEAKSDNVLSSSCLDSAHESGLNNGRDCMASDLDSADESGLDDGGADELIDIQFFSAPDNLINLH